MLIVIVEREKREKELESIVDDIHEEEAKLKDAKKVREMILRVEWRFVFQGQENRQKTEKRARTRGWWRIGSRNASYDGIQWLWRIEEEITWYLCLPYNVQMISIVHFALTVLYCWYFHLFICCFEVFVLFMLICRYETDCWYHLLGSAGLGSGKSWDSGREGNYNIEIVLIMQF